MIKQEGVAGEIPFRLLTGKQLVQRGNLRGDAAGDHALVVLVAVLDDVPVTEGVHDRPENRQQDNHRDDDQPGHGPAVSEEMDHHAFPVALGGEILIDVQVLPVQEPEIFLRRHIPVFHNQCSPLLLPATRMRGSSTP